MGEHDSGVVELIATSDHRRQRNISSRVGVAQPYLVGGGLGNGRKLPPKRLLGKEGLKLNVFAVLNLCSVPDFHTAFVICLLE